MFEIVGSILREYINMKEGCQESILAVTEFIETKKLESFKTTDCKIIDPLSDEEELELCFINQQLVPEGKKTVYIVFIKVQ